MKTEDVRDLLGLVADFVKEIDKECCTLVNGTELGFVNVKDEFQELALKETGKKLTEEPLVEWLVCKKLNAAGWIAKQQVAYPLNPSQSCDIAVKLNGSQLWLELKLAWKAWFNCQGPPKYRNSLYLPYLRGENHSHSFRGDFDKLGLDNWNRGDYRAIVLVGMDWIQQPMDVDVVAIVNTVRTKVRRWEAGAERHWADRRCNDFRLHVWSWMLPPVT